MWPALQRTLAVWTGLGAYTDEALQYLVNAGTVICLRARGMLGNVLERPRSLYVCLVAGPHLGTSGSLSGPSWGPPAVSLAKHARRELLGQETLHVFPEQARKSGQLIY